MFGPQGWPLCAQGGMLLQMVRQVDGRCAPQARDSALLGRVSFSECPLLSDPRSTMFRNCGCSRPWAALLVLLLSLLPECGSVSLGGVNFLYPATFSPGEDVRIIADASKATTTVDTSSLGATVYKETAVISQSTTVKDLGGQQFEITLPIAVTVSTDAAYEVELRVGAASDRQPCAIKFNNYGLLLDIDKSLYKPGQSVLMRALAIDASTKPVTGLPLTLYVIQPEPAKYIVFKETKTADAYGSASFQFDLPQEVIEGEFKVRVESNDVEAHGAFTVEEYVLPLFEVALKQPHTLAHIAGGGGGGSQVAKFPKFCDFAGFRAFDKSLQNNALLAVSPALTYCHIVGSFFL